MLRANPIFRFPDHPEQSSLQLLVYLGFLLKKTRGTAGLGLMSEWCQRAARVLSWAQGLGSSPFLCH